MLLHLLGPPPDWNRPILTVEIDWWRPVRRGSQHENYQRQVSLLGGNFGLKNTKISILTKYRIVFDIQVHCSTIPTLLTDVYIGETVKTPRCWCWFRHCTKISK